ncbi:MAG TPA: protoporphyrinogen oxidase [Aquificaceae bacterium]|nr:protoporphyrinogen oxidase [Aquificaceae bacterium]
MKEQTSVSSKISCIDVLVVGSGISGLSTAYRLKRMGYEVVVYEKEETVGGNIRTLSERGYTFELGPQTILADGEVLGFFKELGLSPLVARPLAKNRFIYKEGKLIPLPMSPLSFLVSPLLSLRGKLRVLGEPWAGKPVKEEESVAEFVRRRLGEEFLEWVVAPFISGVYAGDPERLSVKYAVRRIYELEREFGSLLKGALKKRSLGPGGSLVSFEGGLGALVKRLAADLEVMKENVVLRVRKKEDRFVIDTRGGKVEARALVVSSPAYTSSYLLKDLSWSASLEFDKIEYAPLVVINVGLEGEKLPEGFGVLVPKKAGKRTLGIIFSSQLFPKRAPEGKELVTVYMGGAMDPGVVELSEESIEEIVLRDLEDILGVRNVDFIHIKRWKRAIPQYTIGYGKYIELAREMEEHHRGLFLTGNYLSGVSVADCIKFSGITARKVRDFLSNFPQTHS